MEFASVFPARSPLREPAPELETVAEVFWGDERLVFAEAVVEPLPVALERRDQRFRFRQPSQLDQRLGGSLPRGVDAGDRVEFVEIAPGRYEFIAATRSVTALKGMFGKSRKSVSIEEMNAAIARRGASAK